MSALNPRLIAAALFAAILLVLTACGDRPPRSDETQRQQQELLSAEATAQTGMPAIKNFRERKLMKHIYELRDQDGLATFTYIVPEQTGRPVFLCNSIGYAISDATGYTGPEKFAQPYVGAQYQTITQAEPNGLYTPDVSDANWVMCLAREGSKPSPVLVNARIVVSPFKLD